MVTVIGAPKVVIGTVEALVMLTSNTLPLGLNRAGPPGTGKLDMSRPPEPNVPMLAFSCPVPKPGGITTDMAPLLMVDPTEPSNVQPNVAPPPDPAQPVAEGGLATISGTAGDAIGAGAG
jgi:hypothetical protein